MGASWIPIIMLAAAGFCGGGVYSFAKARMIGFAIVMAIATVFCLGAAWAWWV